ncbi:MAG: hypothetical protein M0Z77_11835 [Thermoplasmatales archaeon]|jgi:uncharacterized protein YneR|nr:hypothetical protein [Candidatus Thermoplasmatota archaeon]MCL6002380.1 hypothetical protein [Candidatus Thermoplasmatota archaeon]MDA8056319.1 hypothetical protein [Thermoplasmatales archaeon]
MKEFPVFSLKEGSKVKIYLRSGNESKVLEGVFKGLSDSFQPLVYLADSDKNYLINMLDIIYIETSDKLEEIEKEKRADYVS